MTMETRPGWACPEKRAGARVLRGLVWMTVMAAASPAAPNPLAPLTAGEIRAAVRIFKASGRLPSEPRFNFLALDEPPKETVLKGLAAPRRAFAVVYDRSANRTYEAVADLSANRLASWKEVPGAQPPVGEADSSLADRIVRSDPRWDQALRERGIRDPNLVYTVAWPAGYFGLPGEDHGRIVRVTPYYGGAGENYYAHPVEGIAVHVNLTTGQVLEFLDTDRNAPVARENYDLDAASNRPLRPPPAPLQIVQSAGPGYRIDNGEVRWQKWRFRYALTPREGLVLYTVGYEDGGRVRPVLYRASLSEMAVPYGDPGGAWFFRNTFDEGELGLGTLASSLRPGADCPTNCRVYDAVVATETGEPRTIPRAVAIYELDGGIAWKHAENTRRARDLVISYLTEAGNYEYGFEWIFHQDGTLESRVLLTGIMAVKGVPDHAAGPHAHLVAKNLAAVHHQHFFCFRLDMDVDGEANQVLEMNSVPVPAGKDNPYGGAFVMKERSLKTERQAERRINLETSRRWIVVNPSVRNSLGQPTGYALLPGENAVPMALPGSWVRKRAGFLNAHVWVTPYSESERYAAGEFPYQSRGNDGLAKWAAADRPIENRDIVLWYTLGITHNPRPEDWPVMPTYPIGFKLVPWGFFSQNPAMDLPPVR
jgi:primary-amine oxidase